MSKDLTNEEISPFNSIPCAYWWFIVTATTVGYGDYYPTSTIGQWIAAFAMIAGVLVIAFPVSVFSDLWSDELKKVKGFESIFEDDNDNDNDNDNTANNGVSDNIGSNKKEEERKSRRPALRRRDQDQYQEINTGFEEFHSKSSTHITMEKEDLNEIVSSIYTIQQNQRRIQRIMKKYYLDEDHH